MYEYWKKDFRIDCISLSVCEWATPKNDGLVVRLCRAISCWTSLASCTGRSTPKEGFIWLSPKVWEASITVGIIGPHLFRQPASSSLPALSIPALHPCPVVPLLPPPLPPLPPLLPPPLAADPPASTKPTYSLAQLLVGISPSFCFFPLASDGN